MAVFSALSNYGYNVWKCKVVYICKTFSYTNFEQFNFATKSWFA